MSLGIVVKGPEGLVLAAESRITLTAQQTGGGTVQAGFDNATKVFGIGKPNNSIGIVTYGLGAIGLRSPYSLAPELQAQLPDCELSVPEFAGKLSQFFLGQWQAEMPADFQGPGITFVVAGFNKGEAYGRVFAIEIPNAPDPTEQNPKPGEFGITWGGQREIVDRLIRGYDHRVLQIAQETAGLSPHKLQQMEEKLEPLGMQMPLPAMSLQDCVDLAVFFVKTTIEAQRLTVGIRGCGGPIDVATITRQEGLTFVQQKKIRGETTTV